MEPTMAYGSSWYGSFNTKHKDEPITYPLRAGTANRGEELEVHLCVLVYLRCRRLSESFYLASNHASAGSFDDLVLVWQPRGHSHYLCYLVQCKQRSRNPPKDCLLKKDDKDFGLKNYIRSYAQIRSDWGDFCVSEGRRIPLQATKCVLYTTATIETTLASLARHGHIKDLLDTGGIVQTLSEDAAGRVADTLGADVGETKEFLDAFVLFHQQARKHELERTIKKEIAMNDVDIREVDSVYKSLCSDIRDWCKGDGGRYYLTQTSSMWQDALGGRSSSSGTGGRVRRWTSMTLLPRRSSTSPGGKKESLLSLQDTPPPSSRSAVEQTCFLDAAADGDCAELERLLRNKVNRMARDADGDNALHRAARGGHLDAVRTLLDAGLVAELRGYQHRSALHWACIMGHAEVAQLLLDKGGVSLGARSADQGYTALHYAAEKGHAEVSQLLLSRGLSAHCQDGAGRTPLHAAAWAGRSEVLELLLQRGGAVVDATDHRKRTPLHLASRSGRLDCVRLLLARGADPDCACAEGKLACTPLHYAAQEGHREVVEQLILGGAEKGRGDAAGDNALHKAAKKGHGQVVDLLLNAGLPVDVRGFHYRTALHKAAMAGHAEVVRLLLKKGARLDARDLKGNTPLDLAVHNSRSDVVDILQGSPSGYSNFDLKAFPQITKHMSEV